MEITLEFVGSKSDLRYLTQLKWLETNMFVEVDCKLYDTHTQEYEITFPSKIVTNNTIAGNIVIKLGSYRYPLVKERFTIWVDKPGVYPLKLIQEIENETTTILKKELENTEFYQYLVSEVFENENIRLGE